MIQNSYLQAVSYYFPLKYNTNSDLSREHPEWSVEKIATKTGVGKRYMADENETASDLGVEAANLLFREYQIQKESIDYLIFCTQSPDYFLPTSACIIQDRLGLKNECGAFDFNLGCSGFVYGLALAKGLIFSNQAANVLLITAETYTKSIHPKDKSNKTIFGDGAAAALITSTKSERYWNAEIKEFSYHTDGKGYNKLILKNKGFRFGHESKSDDVYEDGVFVKNDDFIFMDGKAIFDFTAFEVPRNIEKCQLINNLSMDNVDLYIFHQANRFMINFIRQRCRIPEDKFLIDLADGGNTVSSTIPIALRRVIDNGFNYQHKTVLLSGFGVGLSIGTVIIQFRDND
ncbi:MAG: ketoacyl-ACP synthase III [Syntrophomonas sp.]